MIARGALWLSIGLFALRLARDTAVRREACLILAILVAHGVDLQFSFTTVVTGWSVWLGIGGLGALCYREHFQTQPLADGNNAVPTRTGIRRDAILRVRDLLYIGLLLLACMIWALDARADVLIQRALITPTAADAQAMMTDALHTRPWDDRQYTLAVFNQLQALETWSPDQSLIWLTQAAQFNPYDATTAFLFGVTWVEIANRTQAEGEYQAAVAQAERYFAAAVRLSPLEGSYWREYARLAYWQLNDAERATMLITRALKLAPDDFAAQGLKAQIDLLPLEG
jgi:tetratricopeptide (TPR) repeat protein